MDPEIAFGVDHLTLAFWENRVLPTNDSNGKPKLARMASLDGSDREDISDLEEL